MCFPVKIKNLKVNLSKIINIFNFNNSFNKTTNINSSNNIALLEAKMNVWKEKYTSTFPTPDEFNDVDRIFSDAEIQNSNNRIVNEFRSLAILYYTNLIEQERKNGKDVSVYQNKLNYYKNRH